MKNTLTLLLLSTSSQIHHHQISCIFKIVEEFGILYQIYTLYHLSKPGADCADVPKPGADCTDVPKPGAGVPKPGAEGAEDQKQGEAYEEEVPKPAAE